VSADRLDRCGDEFDDSEVGDAAGGEFHLDELQPGFSFPACRERPGVPHPRSAATESELNVEPAFAGACRAHND
jgi:hypothetical protein